MSSFERGDLWVLAHRDWELQVDPMRGARICSFSLDGKNVLTGPDVDPANYGSTFWTAPQSTWHWPPVPEIDHLPYAVVDCETSFLCAGSLSSQLGVLVTKRFSVLAGSNRACVEYTISNQSSETLRMAPWEISRVHGGLTFFEAGEGRLPDPPLPEPHVLEQGGIVWFAYDRPSIQHDQKLFMHSNAGWLAHVVDGVALIKVFDAVPASKQAPGEATIEIFASGLKDYVEIEQQGAYAKLGPWKDVSWKVEWLLRRVPMGLACEAGNPELAQWVRGLVAPVG